MLGLVIAKLVIMRWSIADSAEAECQSIMLNIYLYICNIRKVDSTSARAIYLRYNDFSSVFN